MFLYFIPRQTDGGFSIPDSIKYAFESNGKGAAKIHRRETMRGPNGAGAGQVICDAGAMSADQCQLALDKQTWAAIYDPKIENVVDRPQVGRYNDSGEPDPAKLQRATMLPGHPVTLGNGSVWVAAIARAWDDENNWFYPKLPHSLAYDPATGKWAPTTVAKNYRRFSELAFAYAEAENAALAEGAEYFEFVDVDELAFAALSVNYRIGQAEFGLFPDADLYSVEVRRELIRAALDIPTIDAWVMKKKEMDSVGSNS